MNISKIKENVVNKFMTKIVTATFSQPEREQTAYMQTIIDEMNRGIDEGVDVDVFVTIRDNVIAIQREAKYFA